MQIDYEKFDTNTLAKIWNKLNCWEWADELGEKPIDWETLNKDKYFILIPIMEEIKEMIGYKECLRWLHLNKLGSTNEQFEIWWKGNSNLLTINQSFASI